MLRKAAIDALHHDIDDAIDLLNWLFLVTARNLVRHGDLDNSAGMNPALFEKFVRGLIVEAKSIFEMPS
ncbi:hypothetical protein [Bradyrhizobium sp. USDA 3364]